MTDPASLQQLHDIVVPPSAPWWPPASGWYAVAAVAAVGTVWFCGRRFRKWRSDAYRRTALGEIARLKRWVDIDGREKAMRKLPELVKRTAMAVWPREQVASLTGQSWLLFLDASGNTDDFTNNDGRLLATLSYAKKQELNEMPDEQVHSVIRIVEKWIRKHRVQ